MYADQFKMYSLWAGLLLLLQLSCTIAPTSFGENSRSDQISKIKLDSLVETVTQLNNQGTALRNNGKFKKALEIHFEALELSKSIGDTLGQIIAHNNIANDFRRTDSNIEATKFYLEALELSSENPDFIKNQAIANNGLGNILLKLNKPDKALSHFLISLDIEHRLNSGLGIAINLANIGEVYRMKGDLKKALEYYQKSIMENSKINNTIGEAICLNAIGRIYRDQQKFSEAVFYSSEAINKLNNTNDSYHLHRFYFNLLETYIQNGMIKKANGVVPKVKEFAYRLNSYLALAETFELISRLEMLKKDYKSVLEAKESARVYKDSAFTKTNAITVYGMQLQFDANKASEKIQWLEQEKKLAIQNKNNQILGILLLCFILITISIFLFYRNRQRKMVNSELQRLNELKTKFFSNISHEFKTPLTLIQGPVKQLLDSELTQSQLESLNLIDKSANTLYNLVTKILNINKVESGKFEVYLQDGNLSVLIQDLADRFAGQADEKKIEYMLDIEPSGVIKLDRMVVEIIVNNLISNAIKYVPINGTVVILGSASAHHYKLRVKNSIDDQQIDVDKIFNRFYAKNQHFNDSTGIGLSLVHEMCKIYNTKLEVNIHEGEWIEFILWFTRIPVSNLDQEQRLLLEANSNDESSMDGEEKKPLLLLVEDNVDMLAYLTSIFSSTYRIVKASNGKEGLQIAQQYIPDIIVSDVMMSGMDGLKFCEKIKNNNFTNHIPVILLSANTEEQKMIEGLTYRADDYMFKPFVSKVLLAKVENLIHLRKLLVDKYNSDIQTKSLKHLFERSDPFQNLLVKIIETEITDPDFGVEQFCRSIGMSRSQLHKKLKAMFDMSTSEFIQYHRLKLASELLLKSHLNVTEICYETGFNSLSYFSKQFKQFFGLSPLEFKKKHLE